MPIQSCTKNRKPGFRFGETGKCYTYTPGDEASRQKAIEKARKQEQAVRATGWKEK